ncbi:50S ribosomal protein L1 [Marinitoga sp. 1135]|uniref:Large ribosomal subunit protein uL1 n=1 Tax=Marinitoga piezophila (strain DSM 14283 / JCM 11233 / KA3) TaxID=443254 RepID=H2J5F8_MARPK|nr:MULTISPECIES: 50S ribosomal protein L1 [Marinitoga]AEX86102.1 ribosomal protein L1 [Marinitoga piezophila KA3]APT76520.1 50S ribosomal protein L1 [Marinitoga sp. 1137]NUU96287.1 50S ribosomal protein L1 [Marinitoga sp. 1135]NUU98206.1 50S ribosomal protein L1 [Marinitoga sp. 1138]
MSRHGKRYLEARKLIDREKFYSLDEALELLPKIATAKFDESVELHIILGIDPRKSDQQVRGNISLPHGTGKNVRVLVFAKGEKVKEALDAGADYAGSDELIQKINEGWTDFDVAIATPDMMREIGRLGKVLGPRGLMPSPKGGTVTNDVADAVKEFKAGKIEVRNDKTGNLHVAVGKKSFEPAKLKENIVEALQQIEKMRPSAAKGKFIRKVSLAPTMGPGMKINVSEFLTEK